MTITDLRIRFKLETGDYPAWSSGPYSYFHCLYGACIHGKLKSIYGFWIEDELGDSRKLREEFYHDFSTFAKYNQTSRKYIDVLKQEYISWLEEKMLSKT